MGKGLAGPYLYLLTQPNWHLWQTLSGLNFFNNNYIGKHVVRLRKVTKGFLMVDGTINKNPSAQADGARAAIAERDQSFLEKVMTDGGLTDPYEARDFTEVVFRVMRDLMTTDAADRVADELHEEVIPAKDKSLQMEVTDLWQDTNPLVGFLSRVRPPWQGPGIFKIDSDRFLFRVANEGGLESTLEDRETACKRAVKAVFSATKSELSEERIQEIASWLPPEGVLELWNKA